MSEATFGEREDARAAVEAFTGKSTWDDPFARFEWAVIEDALASCSIGLAMHEGDLVAYVSHTYSDGHSHQFDDVVQHTCDIAECARERVAIVAALRAAANRIEAS